MPHESDKERSGNVQLMIKNSINNKYSHHLHNLSSLNPHDLA